MKNHRLIYSDFSCRLIDFDYIIRSLWIGFAGVSLVFVVANESGSGFSGDLSREALIIYATVGVFFFFNYLSQAFHWMKKCLMLTGLFHAVTCSFWGIASFGNHRFFGVSIGFLIIYSVITALIIYFQCYIGLESTNK